MKFTHLRVHSHNTLLGATPSLEAIIERAVAEGIEAVALTDFGGLYGAISFDRACREAGIQPLVGMTVPLAAPSAFYRQQVPVGVLTLLAKNGAGYRSLCSLSSALQGFEDREQRLIDGLSWSQLNAHSEGIIAIDGGRDGWLRTMQVANDREGMNRYLAQLAGAYGEEAWIGLTLDAPSDNELAEQAIERAARFGIEPVVVHPVFALDAAESSRLPLLKAIDQNCLLDEVDLRVLPHRGNREALLHWLTVEEIASRYAAFPDAINNVARIIDSCTDAVPDGRPLWPALELPAGQTADDALRIQAEAGLLRRFGDKPNAEIHQRLNHELTVLATHGFAPLFLIVADIVSFARQAQVPVNTRGSVADSLVAYCVGITTVDPIEHDLLFERFLNPARAEMPDIDLDFCSRRRDTVLNYVRQRYGADRVALVATINTLQFKSAIRETGKAYGLDESGIKHLSKVIPRSWHPDPRRRSRKTLEEMLQEAHSPLAKRVLTDAYALQGQPNHLSVHPGGVVITPGLLNEYVPVQWSPKGFLITQFDHRDIEKIGLPKLDLLGIRALTVLADAAELIVERHQPDLRVDEIPLNDQKTGDMIARGDTIGVFQCESAGAKRTLRQLKARSIRDLAVANAFFKPGPATGGMAQAFIRRYRGDERVSFLHPALEPILGTTKGVLLFQEQILRIAREIAGLSWAQADHLRRGMSKFQADEMATMRSAFVAGCQRGEPAGPAFNPQQAATLWDQVMAFAGYGFNQGHATAYADLSYRSAYLRAYWPAEFLTARLAVAGGFHHPAIYMADARRLGIDVRPPHINHSRRNFVLGDEAEPIIWMGLKWVRDLRRSSIKLIVAEQSKSPFSGLRNLVQRVPLQEKEILHLIQCGGLDGLGDSRNGLLAEAEEIKRAGGVAQLGFHFDLGPVAVAEDAAQRIAWEKQLLGVPLSHSPLSVRSRSVADAVPLADVASQRGNCVVHVVVLPGWTGSRGFFISDWRDYMAARLPENVKAPAPWQTIALHGQWRRDEWGGGRFQGTRFEIV